MIFQLAIYQYDDGSVEINPPASILTQLQRLYHPNLYHTIPWPFEIYPTWTNSKVTWKVGRFAPKKEAMNFPTIHFQCENVMVSFRKGRMPPLSPKFQNPGFLQPKPLTLHPAFSCSWKACRVTMLPMLQPKLIGFATSTWRQKRTPEGSDGPDLRWMAGSGEKTRCGSFIG